MRTRSMEPRVHVIIAKCPPRRQRFDIHSQASLITQQQTLHNSICPYPSQAALYASSHSTSTGYTNQGTDRSLVGRLWSRLRQRILHWFRITSAPRNSGRPFRRRSITSSAPFTDGIQLPPAAPKPPLLPRQHSNPLGSLPAPPRPRTLKPLKSFSSTSLSYCSTSSGTPSSPSTPSLHRATPAPASERGYDSLSCE